jgi:hypothetical protein
LAALPQTRGDLNTQTGEIHMRKIKFFAAAAALILAGVGGWIVSTRQATAAAPIANQVSPLDMMTIAKDLPAVRYQDFSLVFD